MKITFYIIRIISGLLIALTGYYSLTNVDFAEYLIVDIGISDWLGAIYLIRLLCGLLIGAGLALIFVPGKQRAAIITALVASSFLLIYQLLQVSLVKFSKCYVCLSEFENISRFQGVYLSIILVVIFSLMLWKGPELKAFRFNKLVSGLLLTIGLVVPFVLNYPPHWAIYGEVDRADINLPLNLTGLRDSSYLTNGEINPNLESGDHLVCMISLTCPYCTRAAYKLHVLKERNPQADITLVMNGDSAYFDRFMKRTLIGNLPFVFVNGRLFNELSENSYPKIYLVKESVAVKVIEFWSLEDNDIPSIKQ